MTARSRRTARLPIAVAALPIVAAAMMSVAPAAAAPATEPPNGAVPAAAVDTPSAAVPATRAAPSTLPPAAPPPITANLDEPPIVGDKDGLLFLRDRRDLVRLYPHAQVDLDAHGFIGSRVGSLRAADTGVDLAPRFFVRRARFDLAGEMFRRLAFDVGLDLTANPAVDGARVDGTSTRVAVADAWGNLDAGRGLSLTMGVFPAPFSLENRTATSDLAMMERNVAIRGFVVPAGKVLGAAIGGTMHRRYLSWDAGVFGAESLSPGEFERRFDGIGRLVWRPLAESDTSPFRALQIGASARVGARNARDATDDAPAITTGQGFALWRPTRLDAAGRLLHVVPSSTQYAAGVEARLPLRGIALRGEAYWVSRNTHEALDGSFGAAAAAANPERDGRIQGVGWYVEASWWPLQFRKLMDGDLPEPGRYPRPDHLELANTTPRPDRNGVEVALLAAGVNATYDPASRSGPADSTAPRTSIDVYQVGLAFNYWQTSRFRLSVNPNVYWAPGSGTPDNLAVVPGNLGAVGERDTGAHVVWEIAARTTVRF